MAQMLPDTTRTCNDKVCCRSTDDAAHNGHLDCLKYAYENGREWDLNTTYRAAQSGHLECLRYAHDSLGARCEWHPYTTWDAAEYGSLECLKYIYKHCGDVATWKTSNLEEELERCPKQIQDFINSVRENWKLGLNRLLIETRGN